eukprot:gene22113-biopygen23689
MTLPSGHGRPIGGGCRWGGGGGGAPGARFRRVRGAAARWGPLEPGPNSPKISPIDRDPISLKTETQCTDREPISPKTDIRPLQRGVGPCPDRHDEHQPRAPAKQRPQRKSGLPAGTRFLEILDLALWRVPISFGEIGSPSLEGSDLGRWRDCLDICLWEGSHLGLWRDRISVF